MSDLQPLNDGVLVEPIEIENKSEAGLFIVGREPIKRGTVVAVGPGKLTEQGTRAPVGVHVGQVVLYYGRNAVDLKGKQVLLRENDLLAVEA